MDGTPQLTLYRNCVPVTDGVFARGGDRSLTEAIVDTVAAAEGITPTALPSLYEAIDLDALATLFDRPTEDSVGEVVVCFRVDNWNVFVSGEGRIRVCDSTRTTVPELVFD